MDVTCFTSTPHLNQGKETHFYIRSFTKNKIKKREKYRLLFSFYCQIGLQCSNEESHSKPQIEMQNSRENVSEGIPEMYCQIQKDKNAVLEGYRLSYWFLSSVFTPFVGILKFQNVKMFSLTTYFILLQHTIEFCITKVILNSKVCAKDLRNDKLRINNNLSKNFVPNLINKLCIIVLFLNFLFLFKDFLNLLCKIFEPFIRCHESNNFFSIAF